MGTSRIKRHRRSKKEAVEVCETIVAVDKRKEKIFEALIITVFLAFGMYHCLLYFGHKIVPNSDFSGFVRVGEELLSFKLPSSYKRAPALGLLQAGLSHFVGGQHPQLTAGWLLNAILHPLNIVLLWLVGKRIVGRAAFWMVIVIVINPWLIQMLTQPIAETTLLFFVLLTFYFMFRRSRWCYLFAAIASVVRYEGAALIMAAFLMDMIESRDNEQRKKSFILVAIASAPLMLWLIGTAINFGNEGSTHYLKELGVKGAFCDTLLIYIRRIWDVGFYPLFTPSPVGAQDSKEIVFNLSKIFTAVSIVFGVAYGLWKRRWDILALLLFFVPYILVHVIHSYTFPRFMTPVSWITLVLCLYGLQNGWLLINKAFKPPKAVVSGLQIILLVVALGWLVMLVPYLSKLAQISPRSASMPDAAMVVVVLFFIGQRFIHKMRFFWRDCGISALVCLMIISNQFLLVRLIGNGQGDLEFKHLADWYTVNSKSGEKLATTMPGIVKIFAPAHTKDIVNMDCSKAESAEEYIQQCYQRDITYVAWDSRVGSNRGSRYYKLWKMENIAMLEKPQSTGPYEFVTQLRANKRRFINLFRLNAR